MGCEGHHCVSSLAFKAELKALGMNQKMLASIVGITPEAMSRQIARGPSDASLAIIAAVRVLKEAGLVLRWLAHYDGLRKA